MITEIDDFFNRGCGRCQRFDTPDCSVQRWHDGLLALRRICLDAGLVETVKWGHPCYMHADRNIAILGAFRENFRITFFNAALLQDPDGILQKQGPNSQHPDAVIFTDNGQVGPLTSGIAACLKESMGYADAGIKPEKSVSELPLPEEMVDALDADPELADAYWALTPGRRKSYVLHVGAAKKPETRTARIERSRDKILAGKGALEQ